MPDGSYIVRPQRNLPPTVDSDSPIHGYVSTCLPMGNRPSSSICPMMYGGGSDGVEMDRTTCPAGYGRVRCTNC